MINVEKFVRPASVDAAMALLQESGSLALAGGTGVSLSKDPNLRIVVDLSDLHDLKHIDVTAERVRLGALVTMTQIRHATNLPSSLVAAARSIGSTPLRNVITVGGELARGVYWNDLPVLLLAMDATVELSSAAGSERVPVAVFLAEHPKRALAGGKLITSVEFSSGAFPMTAYLKYARTEVDYAICDVACGLRVEEGVIREARLALGAIVPLARRVPEAEQVLLGQLATAELFDRVAKTVVETVEPRPDFRVSREYQRHLIEALVRRALESAIGPA